MAVHVHSSKQYFHNIHTRIPFRYGIVTMRAVPHLFFQLECDVDGVNVTGTAAENLIPKWFTKDPHTTYRQDLDEMLHVIQAAAGFAGQVESAGTVFELWRQVYSLQEHWAEAYQFPPLLWNFGVSMVERALVDAFCRAAGLTFSQALRSNALGIRLGQVHEQLQGYAPADLLPAEPLHFVNIRHTIGLQDALTDGDIDPSERVADGLPQSLEENIRAYNLDYFKIKVSGDLQQDAERLCRIASAFDGCGLREYRFSLDGNEQYRSVAEFRSFWEGIHADSACAPAMRHLLFVEQPFHREVALSPGTCSGLLAWEQRPAMIIDESDCCLESLPTALQGGYAGTSHKNCKGIMKGIANACLLEYHRRANPQMDYVLSGEDLTNIGPVALLQDLTLMASLGIEHVERNGHHYFSGLSMFPQEVQSQVLTAHPDLYYRHERGFAALRIEKGRVQLGSLLQAPFGVAADLDLSCCFTPADQWSFDSFNSPVDSEIPGKD